MSEAYLAHIGVAHDADPPGRGSGRFEYGSGENPNQHIRQKSLAEQKAYWKNKINPETGKPYGDGEIAIILGYKNSSALRNAISAEKDEKMMEDRKKVLALYNNGIKSPTQIAKETGLTEPNVRAILKRDGEGRKAESERIKQQLRDLVEDGKYINVTLGAEYALGITETKKKRLLAELEEEGYVLQEIKIDQLGTGYKTTLKVLCAPGTTPEELKEHKFDIQPVDRFIENPDGTRSVLGLPPINSIDSDRVLIRYAEDGGKEKDGLIELKRGVEELSLNNATYAQVRIGVDDKLYLKGMAVYGDDADFPPGKDIIFNTNKTSDTPLEKTLKPMKIIKGTDEVDMDNPFGASIKNENEIIFGQRYFTDPKTGEQKVSAINIVTEEGDWSKWSKNLSSQFLSKQNLPLIKQQLNVAYLKKVDELSDIMSIQNDSVRRVMLMDFADKCDSAAVDLKAAALPRQQTHVLIPLTSIKENEVYAPRYNDGDQIILVRYPHAGTFEIPVLTVNNKNKEGISMLGKNPMDAVGISSHTAGQLSGADFDGDTALVIPITSANSNGSLNIRTRKAIKELQDFEPKVVYKAYDGMKEVKKDNSFDTQREMGKISNLITDMTLIGAPERDVIKAVRHSMVIIDAEKHNLNWRQSEIDNDIKALHKKYQGKESGGAKTIISRASSEYRIEQESLQFTINPETGEKINRKTGEMRREYKIVGHDENGKPIKEETGNWVPKTQKSTKMRETSDAYTLLSGYDANAVKGMSTEEMHKYVAARSYAKEVPYADYANQMKSLANQARLERQKTETAKKDSNAAKVYAAEAESLNTKYVDTLKNAPREQTAQLRAAENYYKKKNERDDLEQEDYKKLKNQCLTEARIACGAKSQKVTITPKEWEAIENRAISGTRVEKIINKSDKKAVLSYALPKEKNSLSNSKIALIRAMVASGHATSEIAAELNISPSTVDYYTHPTPAKG